MFDVTQKRGVMLQTAQRQIRSHAVAQIFQRAQVDTQKPIVAHDSQIYRG